MDFTERAAVSAAEFPFIELGDSEHHLPTELSRHPSLIDLILTLPAQSNLWLWRGFSQSNIIKNDWRNKLKDTHVSDSLCVILETPNEQEFCPKPAVEHWSVCSKRLPEHPAASNSCAVDCDSDDSVDHDVLEEQLLNVVLDEGSD